MHVLIRTQGVPEADVGVLEGVNWGLAWNLFPNLPFGFKHVMEHIVEPAQHDG